MANKLINLKGFKEEKSNSISKYNFENGTQYFLFDPDNITDYKSTCGFKNNKKMFLHEYIQCMWGNDEIDEYIFFDNSYIENALKDINFSVLEINGIKIRYAYKKKLFSRYIFNSYLTINGITYYVFVKTIEKYRFKKLMEDFICGPINN